MFATSSQESEKAVYLTVYTYFILFFFSDATTGS